MSYGFAGYLSDALPDASPISFTGTTIEKTDANTRVVFGDYIFIYDIQRAVVDKATAPICCEIWISETKLRIAEPPKIDADYQKTTEATNCCSDLGWED